MPSSFKPSAVPGRLHHYTSRLVAFEHYLTDKEYNNNYNNTNNNKSITNTSPSTISPDSTTAKNILLWIGGLGDGLLTVPYVRRLAQALPQGWILVEILLSSSYNGWGTSSLKRDVQEIEKCVEYLRGDGFGRGKEGEGKGMVEIKIVLMGHSTGCQDMMEYLINRDGSGNGCDGGHQGKNMPVPIQGAILQAPVSDREGLVRDLSSSSSTTTTYESSVRMAQDWVTQGRGEDVLPETATGGIYGKAPISARRWLGLASPGKDGDDDYFSSDLSDEQLRRTFGRLPRSNEKNDMSCPILILYSGQDEHVPEFVDKEALVRRWMSIMRENGVVVDEENGGVLPGAHHSFKQDSEEIVEDLIRRVRRFLVRIDDGS